MTQSQENRYPQSHSQSNGFQVVLLPHLSVPEPGPRTGSCQYECELALYADTSAVSQSVCLCVCVCARVCLFVYVCVCFKSLQSCGAVDSPVLSDPLSYPTGIVSCSLACICCRHCENQSRLFRDGLDRMLIRHECFLVIGNYHNPVGILKISF